MSFLIELLTNPYFWGLLASLGLLAWLIKRLINQRKKKRSAQNGLQGRSGSGQPDYPQYGGLGNNYDDYDQADDYDGNFQRQQREKRLKESIPNINDMLKQSLLKMAGVNHTDLKRLGDEDVVRRLAEILPDHLVETIEKVSTQEINFDVGTSESTQSSIFPENDVNVRQVDQLTPMQLGQMLPEEMVLDDDTFYQRLAMQDLLRLDFLRKVVEEKQAYVLLDVSGSMDEYIQPVGLKHVVARAVVLKLLCEAVEKGSKFLIRFFDGGVHSLIKATNSEEAERAITKVLGEGFSGGGTNITGAIETAVEDIIEEQAVSLSQLLLITDGEDSSVASNLQQLKTLLGDDINLHVLTIGNDNEDLEKIATSYKRIA